MKRIPVVGLLAGFLFFCSGFYARLIPAPIRVDYIAVLALALIISLQRESPFPSFENRFLDWLGSISYEIYVVQILVIVLLSGAYVKAGLLLPSYVIYLLCIAIVIGVAWCFRGALNLWDISRFRQRAK